MPRALSRSDLELANAAILAAHRLIHHALIEKRVTAATIAELSAGFMEASNRLRSLATSPFLAIEPAPHDLPEPPE
jgi:hypothetical protein